MTFEVGLEGWEKVFLNREGSGHFHTETLHQQKPGGWMDRCVPGIGEITQTQTPEQREARNVSYCSQQARKMLLENCVCFKEILPQVSVLRKTVRTKLEQ